MRRAWVVSGLVVVGLLVLASGGPDAPAPDSAGRGFARAVAEAPSPDGPPEFMRAGGVSSYWTPLASGSFSLVAPGAHEVRVTVPERTVALLVNVTPERGASMGFGVRVEGGCDVSFGPLVGDGAAWGADCGAMLPGVRSVALWHEGGALAGRFSVAALVCVEGHSCPGPGAEYR